MAKKAREQRIKARKARTLRNRAIAVVVIVVIATSLGVVYYFNRSSGTSQPNESPSVEPNKALLQTSMGNITIQLYEDMPITTGNFRDLVKRGVYDGTIFHRVVHDFVVQGGDATSKGITVPTIRDELPNKHSNIRGSVAMAKTSQPDSATSQFYINLKDNAGDLDSNYSVFGTVILGMDVVDAIGQVATDSNDKPLQDVMLIKATLVE